MLRLVLILVCACGKDMRSADSEPDASDPRGADAAQLGVPIFIAQGMLGRTTISCDDGRTWVGDHSWEIDGDAMMCGMPQDVRCGTSTCSYQINNQCEQHQCCNDTP